MQIEFDFDMNDWMALQTNRINTLKQMKALHMIMVLMMPAASCVMIIYEILTHEFSLTGLIVYAIISLLWVLFVPKWYKKRVLARVRKQIEDGDNSGILGKQTLIFTDDGITQITNEAKYETKWSGIKKLVEIKDYYFLYNTAVSAIIIPKQKIAAQLTEVDRIIKSKIALQA
jgi:hypothetical protein